METTLKTAKDFREYFSKGEEQLNALIEEYLRAATDDDLERLVKHCKGTFFTHPEFSVDVLSLLRISFDDYLEEKQIVILTLADSYNSQFHFPFKVLTQEDKLTIFDKIQEIL